MNRTKIEWVKNPDGSQGYTWNPITGCLNGCPYCYARKLANRRLKSRYLANKNWDTHTPKDYEGYPNLDPFYPRFWEDRMWLPELVGTKRKPKGIFVCDMSDLFGIGVPGEWTKRVLDVIRKHPRHRFYLLTKQPQKLILWSPFPPNAYVGVSATNSIQYATAAYWLREIEAKIKFVSFEPLLERIAPKGWPWQLFPEGKPQDICDWVIIGAQTPYSKKTAPRIEWVKEIVEAADRAGIPVFLKNNLRELLVPDALMEDLFWVDERAKLRQEFPR